MSQIQDVNQEIFDEEVFKSDIPVLIDFYTDGCGPCEALVPVLDEIAAEYVGKLKIAKFYVSLDEVLENSNEVAKKYDVMGFPTIILMKAGEVFTTLLGGQGKDDLLKEINKMI
ncbi:thiol reductase thioredoxin [Ornithinibacillus gellani]|uniref:thioredoxin family protein n=1 Tax=Ornithinibacillus gellani TaxID=2293253 RepID=UPI000F4A9411|nr:thioredoxin domain-containing protein [Ornithinibacillus gellani]TQS74770.1 thiol reductase thioredoxin [Ornithinibacillus gellani]